MRRVWSGIFCSEMLGGAKRTGAPAGAENCFFFARSILISLLDSFLNVFHGAEPEDLSSAKLVSVLSKKEGPGLSRQRDSHSSPSCFLLS